MTSLFLLLDIDNTLYEYSETGFHNEMHDRIFGFAEQKLGFSAEKAAELSRKYWMDYGLSLHGYVKEYHVNAKEYSDYVHQCSYYKLQYNAPLVAMLKGMQYNPDAGATGSDHLYYFTNANRAHARHVLEPQGLRPLFTRPRPDSSPLREEHRVDDADGFEDGVEWLGYSYEDQWRLTMPDFANKPMRRAYEAIYDAITRQVEEDVSMLHSVATAEGGTQQAAASPSSPNVAVVQSQRAHLCPAKVVMVDDSLMNLDAPLELGWSAVWYAHGDQQLPSAQEAPHYTEAVAKGRLVVIRHVLELRDAVEMIRSAVDGAFPDDSSVVL